MIIVMLVVLGLIFGSFTNALIWRLHEQDNEKTKKRPNKKYLQELSVSKGRSMCPNCKHQLHAIDLIPVFSWFSTKGRCRYCHKSVSVQYPLVELLMAGLYVASYLFWPEPLHGLQVIAFTLWLLLLIGFVALAVYDSRWFLLPTRMIYPLYLLAIPLAVVQIVSAERPLQTAVATALAALVGGGIFYVMFQVSKGAWIGGGDIRLGWLLGLILATPARSLLCIFLAAALGTLVSLPLLGKGKLQAKSMIPFGPMLIVGAIITQLFGQGPYCVVPADVHGLTAVMLML